MRAVRIYVEGGGDGRDSKAMLRDGMGRFLRDMRSLAREKGIRWHVVATGSRNATRDAFETACRTHPDAVNLLLVDAEGPVSSSPREHLRERDRWRLDASDDTIHMMVQTMEAWLLADIETLSTYYGQGFQDSAVPSRGNVEEIGKAELAQALTRATRNTQKGRYHKIRHGTAILGKLTADKVRARAPHCDRLFRALIDILNSSAAHPQV